MATPADSRRRPGPKGGDAAVRDALLQAAAGLLSDQGFAALTQRGVADRAGVTPPMVKYYFQDTRGLLEALLEAGFEPILAILQQAAAAPAVDPRALVRSVAEALCERPWLPILLVHGVFASQELRTLFATRYASRVRALLVQLLGLAQQGGRLRPGLDPALTPLSLVSLLAFPFLARPVVEEVMGLQLDRETAHRLADQITALVLETPPDA